MKYLTHSLVLFAATLCFFDQAVPADRSSDAEQSATNAQSIVSNHGARCGETMNGRDERLQLFVESQSGTIGVYAFAKSTRPVRRATAHRR